MPEANVQIVVHSRESCIGYVSKRGPGDRIVQALRRKKSNAMSVPVRVNGDQATFPLFLPDERVKSILRFRSPSVQPKKVREGFEASVREETGKGLAELPIGQLTKSIAYQAKKSRLVVRIDDIHSSIPWELLLADRSGKIAPNVVVYRQSPGDQHASGMLLSNNGGVKYEATPAKDACRIVIGPFPQRANECSVAGQDDIMKACLCATGGTRFFFDKHCHCQQPWNGCIANVDALKPGSDRPIDLIHRAASSPLALIVARADEDGRLELVEVGDSMTWRSFAGVVTPCPSIAIGFIPMHWAEEDKKCVGTAQWAIAARTKGAILGVATCHVVSPHEACRIAKCLAAAITGDWDGKLDRPYCAADFIQNARNVADELEELLGATIVVAAPSAFRPIFSSVGKANTGDESEMQSPGDTSSVAVSNGTFATWRPAMENSVDRFLQALRLAVEKLPVAPFNLPLQYLVQRLLEDLNDEQREKFRDLLDNQLGVGYAVSREGIEEVFPQFPGVYAICEQFYEIVPDLLIQYHPDIAEISTEQLGLQFTATLGQSMTSAVLHLETVIAATSQVDLSTLEQLLVETGFPTDDLDLTDYGTATRSFLAACESIEVAVILKALKKLGDLANMQEAFGELLEPLAQYAYELNLQLSVQERGSTTMYRYQRFLKAVGKAAKTVAGPFGAPLAFLLSLYEDELRERDVDKDFVGMMEQNDSSEVVKACLEDLFPSREGSQLIHSQLSNVLVPVLQKLTPEDLEKSEEALSRSIRKILEDGVFRTLVDQDKLKNEISALFEGEDLKRALPRAFPGKRIDWSTPTKAASGFLDECMKQRPETVADAFNSLSEEAPGSNPIRDTASLMNEFMQLQERAAGQARGK